MFYRKTYKINKQAEIQLVPPTTSSAAEAVEEEVVASTVDIPIETINHCLQLCVCLLSDVELKLFTPQLRSNNVIVL